MYSAMTRNIEHKPNRVKFSPTFTENAKNEQREKTTIVLLSSWLGTLCYVTIEKFDSLLITK